MSFPVSVNIWSDFPKPETLSGPRCRDRYSWTAPALDRWGGGGDDGDGDDGDGCDGDGGGGAGNDHGDDGGTF